MPPSADLRFQTNVFINVPYDEPYEDLFLALIAGLSLVGLTPRATLEIPGSERRLDRILDLLHGCRYSVHDLSRVEIDRHRPPAPRFNMPFELGLAVAHAKQTDSQHEWFVLETVPRRILKSLSDLNGTDVYIHSGTPAGLMREILNAFARADWHPSVAQMLAVFRKLKKSAPQFKRSHRTDSLYTARLFRDLVGAATQIARDQGASLQT